MRMASFEYPDCVLQYRLYTTEVSSKTRLERFWVFISINNNGSVFKKRLSLALLTPVTEDDRHLNSERVLELELPKTGGSLRVFQNW